LILKELKIYNYVPSAAERDYLEAMWRALKKLRDEKKL